ncbi:Lrp/AsnC family transcriptional regulator [Nocardioides sp. Kera G14]|uniref:Lrp/AsnC family transcriptional regulator n=1 Tax=Nocardioides sp. Kera G14 TaxID=2884264 RepID=UPI001D0F5E2E|nr:AsnC family transcriptional regulator [Nocardioides sp. Kera G14]UDY23596.1 Lrp/AsnC family transcriptional regulator [Nocardioides sp. Kera G14]
MDAIDRQILELLAKNARRPVAEIAEHVGLSPAPVARRIDRLERDGVIEGYTTVVNYARTGTAIEAFIEVRMLGSLEVDSVWADLEVMPEVVQMLTIAGDPDALVRVRVDNVDHLARVVNQMRKTGKLLGTKTLIVLDELTPGR